MSSTAKKKLTRKKKSTRSVTPSSRRGLTWEERVREAEKSLSPSEKRLVDSEVRRASRSGARGEFDVVLVESRPRRKRSRSEAELRAAYRKALDRIDDLRDALSTRDPPTDELYEWRDTVDDAKHDLRIAAEDLVSAGYSVDSHRRHGDLASARGSLRTAVVKSRGRAPAAKSQRKNTRTRQKTTRETRKTLN